MEKVKLGTSNLNVSPIGLGTMLLVAGSLKQIRMRS